MKLLYICGLVFMLLNVYSFQLVNSQETGTNGDAPTDAAAGTENADNGGADDSDATAPGAQENDNNDDDQTPPEDNPSDDANGDAAQDDDTGSSPAAASNDDVDAANGTSSDAGDTPEGNNDADDADDADDGSEDNTDSRLADLSITEDCKTSVTACLNKLNNKPTLDKVDCDKMKNQKDCVTNSTAGGMCSADDYEKLEDSVCFCPRSVPSLILVGVLCVLAKLFVQQ